MRPRVAIVGTVVADEIARPGVPPTRSLGGIAYTVAALSSLAGDRLDILPVCRVGDDLRSILHEQWRSLPGVSLAALLPYAGPHTRVRLDYTAAGLGPGERLERLLHPLPPLAPGDLAGLGAGDLAGLGAVDLALLNCISGFDLTLEAAEALSTACRLYLDVHSLALERLEDGARRPRAVPDAGRWLACADWVQCNEREAAALAAGSSEPSSLARAIAAAGRPRCGLLTLGAAGAAVVRPDTAVEPLPAPWRSDGDPTGAGDTFGAAFVAAVLDGDDDVRAARKAVRAATVACSFDGVAQMTGLAAAIRCSRGRRPGEAPAAAPSPRR